MSFTSQEARRPRARRGHFIVATTLVLMVVVFGLSGLLPARSRIDAFQSVGVGAVGPMWLDLRVIAAAIHESDNNGNPYLSNPGDPLNRPFNYPQIWLKLRLLTWGEMGILGYAVVQAVVAGFLFLKLLGRVDLSHGALVSLLLASPAVLLLVERANTDLTIFSLLISGSIAAGMRRCTYRGPALIAAAAFLKIYPTAGVVVLPALVRRKTLLAAVLAVLGTVCWLLIDFEAVKRAIATTQSGWLSYGFLTTAHFCRRALHIPAADFPISVLVVRVTSAFAFFLSLVIGHFAKTHRLSRKDRVAERAFVISAAVYVSTFLAGSNFDYRLVFLLLGLRFIVRRGWGRWTIAWWVSTVLALWSSAVFGSSAIAVHAIACFALLPVLGYFSGAILWPMLASSHQEPN